MPENHPTHQKLSEHDLAAALEKLRLLVKKLVFRHLRGAEKALQQVLRECDRCRAWEKVHHEALLLQANMYKIHKGMEQVEVSDWENGGCSRLLKLNTSLEPAEEMIGRFKEAKRFKRGLVYAEARAQEFKTRVDAWRNTAIAVEQLQDPQQLQDWYEKLQNPRQKSTQKQQRTTESTKPYHEFCSTAGLKIWVGKNDKGNDKLTFSCARGADWWFHVQNYPGSHVVLRVEKGRDPDDTSIEEAIQLALAYSKAQSIGEAEVCVTQCKYVHKLGRGKGKPGSVQISKHKNVHARYNKEKVQTLKRNSKSTLPL